MNWRIWLATCLLAAVTGVLAGAVVVGVNAQAVQPASADTGSDAGLLADTGLPVPGERPPTATAGRPAQVATARTVPATQAAQAAREKSKESDKGDRSKRAKKGGDKSG
jgi:hypothetical protein